MLKRNEKVKGRKGKRDEYSLQGTNTFFPFKLFGFNWNFALADEMTVRNSIKVSRLNGEFSPGNRNSDDKFRRRTCASESDNDDQMSVHCDGNTLHPTLDVSSQQRLEPEKHAKHNSLGKLKFAASKVPLIKESLLSPLCSIAHDSEIKFHQSYGSIDPVVQYRRSGRIRSKVGVEKPTCEMPLQRDIDAALALVDMANEVPCFPTNDLQSHDSHYQVSKKAKKHFGEFQKSAVEDQMKGETGERLQFSLSGMAYSAVRKQKKRKAWNDFSLPPFHNINDYVSEEDDNLYETCGFFYGHGLTIRSGKERQQHIEACLSGSHHSLGMLSLVCKLVTKTQKGKPDMAYVEGPDESDFLHSRSVKLIEEPSTPLKKQRLKKPDAKAGSLAWEASDQPLLRKAIDDVVPKTKPLEKQRFTRITPTIRTGFSFSIIHLLSSIRIAMVTPHTEDASLFGKHFVKSNPEGVSEFHSHGIKGKNNNSEQTKQKNLPSLTIQEIVQRVSSNPGDPCILATKEPLPDLVRGVLKIFSSKIAPLGAKGWRALTLYEKSSKSWSWIGPVTSNSSIHDLVEEEISSEAWGLPHRLLVKLVDSFTNWLKNGQERLQQIGSLPPPPMALMQPTVDVKERFRYQRCVKSIITISPSSEEVRAYFRREEVLRYLVPDRAFSYTAADGRKSTVAPLRRCSGKPSSKCRDHFMLKSDRPPHVTILCLVRDAAARLPGSIGTRADVCILMRDSQYIVEDVSNTQINQVVSGALDRLHYELDPCIQFDGDRKLWVYLHGEREKDEFSDDGTSSTMKLKWKRKQKPATETVI